MISKRIVYAAVIVIILLGIGTTFYSLAEGWSLVDSFYFSTVTLTTIGFGDFAPTHEVTKVFTSVYALLGIGVMLYILSSVIGTFIFKQEKYFDRLFFPMKNFRKQEKAIKKERQVIREQQRQIREQKKEIRAQRRIIERIRNSMKRK